MKEILKIKKNSTVIVALSGGPDSVYLLHYLQKQAKKQNLTLIGAHLNHSTRFLSNRDERFCKKLCKKLDIQFESKKVHLKNASEDIARKKRYAFFEELVSRYKAKYIATGHHINDSIETVLFNLTRGCSLKGLTGIPRQRTLGRAEIIRPIAHLSKKQILTYLKKHQIKYMTDSTNKKNLYSRNKIRNLVIPVLKKINPGLEKTFTRNIEHFQKIQDFIEKQAQNWLDTEQNHSSSFSIKEFKKLDEILQNEVLTLLYKKETDSTQGLTLKQIENAKNIILKNKNLKGKLGKVKFETSYGQCEFETSKKNSPPRGGSEISPTFRHTVKVVSQNDFHQEVKNKKKKHPIYKGKYYS